ncbi:MAG: hypothetical protein ACJA2S_002590 [Cyclobacteriaceae bacterium]|jgi:hypothetical protein
MSTVDHHDRQYLSLLKTVAAEVIHQDSDYKGTPNEHPLMKGIEHYCCAVCDNEDLDKPDEGIHNEESPEVIAYLTYLHHRKAHAKIADNKEVEKDLEEQLASFKFGNPKWQSMFDIYIKYYWDYPMHLSQKPQYRSWRDPKFGDGDYQYGVVDWKIPSDATVALIGDIGTGTDIAAAVLLGALSFKPDVILHLGDVYYSGTEEEFNRYFIGLIKVVFEDQGVNIPVFTLPGNHEYFTGAIPYFKCLDSNLLVQDENQRQQASFFKLDTDDGGWQFLGMDSSFHGHFMGGPVSKMDQALKDLHLDAKTAHNPIIAPDMVYVRPDELNWHHYHLNEHQGRTILLGHHQVYSRNQTVGITQAEKDGKPDPQDINRAGVNTRLWKGFGAYFDKVAAWFWGHEHNLCIYEDNFRPEGWPEATNEPDDQLQNLKKGRCIGHSAIPVSESEEPYKINNNVPFVRDDLELSLKDGWYNRGFEIIKLNGKGNDAITTYYQVSGAEPEPIKIYEESLT